MLKYTFYRKISIEVPRFSNISLELHVAELVFHIESHMLTLYQMLWLKYIKLCVIIIDDITSDLLLTCEVQRWKIPIWK